MSGPIDRSLDPNEVSFYAPKRARDKGTGSGPLTGIGPDQATNASAGIPGPPVADDRKLESESFRRHPSLGPTLVPKPPDREPWRLGKSRTTGAADNGGARSFIFILLAVCLAASIAFGLVLASPTIERFITAPGTKSKVALGNERPAAPAPMTRQPTPAATNAWPSGRDAALDPPVNVPGVFDSRSGTKQLSSDRLAWIHPRRETQGEPATQPAAAAPAPPPPVSASAPPVAPAPKAASRGPEIASAEPVSPVPKTASPPPVPASAAPVAATTGTGAAVPTGEEPRRVLGKDQIEMLLKQGQDFVSVGDFPSARLLFKRIAEAGDARGAFALAATYDPVALAKIGATGAKPDEAKAREWYQKAKALDGEKTGLQLNALTIKLP